MSIPDATYITNLLATLIRELEGFHRRINEVENLRYMEDKIALPPQDKPAGLELRVGLTAELIENVKAALTTNEPVVKVKALRVGNKANENATKRALFWTAFIQDMSRTTPVLDELVDAVAGLGCGILKATFAPWPKAARRKRKNEDDKDYLERQDALKRQWGPPFRVITVHPLCLLFRPGPGNRLTETLEHSYKPRRDAYPGLEPVTSETKPDADALAASSGLPVDVIKPTPVGFDQSDMLLTTEYWRPDLYQIWLGSNKVHEQANPGVAYFIAVGRSSSSKDPDKFGLSVADVLRHTEPHINRTLTRMAEAAELLVKKRLTVELPEGTGDDIELDDDNNPVPTTFKFSEEVATALPGGAKIHDPFAGVENIYAAMPFIQLLMMITARHGVSPIFKGQSPGAAGSGYRDTSLYMMALSQFKNLLKSYASCLTGTINWLESSLVTHAKQKIWVGDLSLEPSDITNFPAVLTAEVEPFLPQNVIAEGHFYDYMHQRGHITRRMVRTEGMAIKDPEAVEKARMLEDLQEMLRPILYKDVLQRVGILPDAPLMDIEGGAGDAASAGGRTDINTIIRGAQGQSGGGQQGGGAASPSGGRVVAGAATGGESRRATQEPGSPPQEGAPNYQD